MRIVNLPYEGDIEVYDWREGVEIINHARKTYPKYEHVMGRDTRIYSGAFGAFDIETSSVDNDDYDPVTQTAMYKRFSFPYCWQFMIDGKFIFGQDPADFFRMLDGVNRFGSRVVIFIHNITFEYNNLADFFLAKKGVEIFWKTSATPLYIRYGCFEFRCSALLTHKGLAKLGREIGYEKLKGDLDYSIPRGFREGANLSPLEMDYCYRDVAILSKWIEKECENYLGRLDPSSLPFTQTGYTRRLIQERFSKTPLGKSILKKTAIDIRAFQFLNSAFYGGYTHENFRRVGERIHRPKHRDITSAYPAQMVLGKFPHELHFLEKPNGNLLYQYCDPAVRNTTACIARVRFKNFILRQGGIPYAPYNERGKFGGSGVICEGGKVLYADEYEATFCDVDLRLIFREYDYDDEIEVVEMMVGRKESLPDAVIETVLELFEKKTTLKGETDPDKVYDYNLSKQLINSLYGISAQSLLREKYVINGLQTEIETDANGDPVYEYDPAKTLPYQWGVYITALVREVIYNAICGLEDKNDFIYSDTDSVFYISTPANEEYFENYNDWIIKRLKRKAKRFPNIIPKNRKGEPQYLGTLLLENDDCEYFSTVGSKRYYIEHPDGTIDLTVSGLRATKTWYDKDENGDEIRRPENHHNGRNVDRLIEKYGSIERVFDLLVHPDPDNPVTLEYEPDTDKLSNYNTRHPYRGTLCGETVSRPCSYILYPVGVTLSLNESILNLLTAKLRGDTRYDVVYDEIY